MSLAELTSFRGCGFSSLTRKESRGCKGGEALVGGCIVQNCIESGLLTLIGELVMHEPEIPAFHSSQGTGESENLSCILVSH